ncbi:transporter substrate-binding domain-containing protein [Clostridium botulinum]|uniref:Amino acid ABC transporter, substrate-binding protein n=1 Tax=Clostridium botulinum D str. 1873 TaxID=592027 RepID=A0A9P2G8N3_CLOBO|nr:MULTISPECIES: transporter substrate-binding domain-containing protein [Clostridium]AYF53903.1 amino acid ABC transporter [Clostridium novyi]EES91926.1 amino acid ABC transporter, substrate-binding protein [Clostridium botulinum D str. 1873]MBO3441158.1 transporter substrate-binding domain-containing protein [Clostridium haemolyticum]NFV46735.1 transporter substrate-binding domain-containing protein [Clostridium botulinum]QPW55472.1 transporter substrate-binding domain-containing protein [Cl
MLKGKKLKFIICSLMLTMGATVFVGCGNKNQGKNIPKIEQIKKSGKLVLGTCADYPPYEVHKVKDGKDEIVGFDIDIAKEIAKDLGVKLEIKDMDFDPLVLSVKSGKVDLVLSGMNPTPAREKEIDFSKIYYRAKQSVIIRKDDKDKLKNLETLSGKKIGAQITSLQEKIAKEEIKGANVISLGKVNELVLGLKGKKTDAVIVEEPVAKAYVAKYPELMIANINVGKPNEGSAVGIQKGSKDFLDSVNKTIDRLNSKNEIQKMIDKASEELKELVE